MREVASSRSTTIASWVLLFYCNKFLDMSPRGCNFRNILACGSKSNNGSAKNKFLRRISISYCCLLLDLSKTKNKKKQKLVGYSLVSHDCKGWCVLWKTKDYFHFTFLWNLQTSIVVTWICGFPSFDFRTRKTYIALFLKPSRKSKIYVLMCMSLWSCCSHPLTSKMQNCCKYLGKGGVGLNQFCQKLSLSLSLSMVHLCDSVS